MSSNYIYTPYTYLIGWSKHNKWYYGVRYSRKSSPDDLWIKYFTSSEVVKNFRQLNGDPDIIQIRKTFDDATKAKRWEEKVLRSIPKHLRENWLNISFGSLKGLSTLFTNPLTNPAKTEKHRQMMKSNNPMKSIDKDEFKKTLISRKSNKGTHWSEESKRLHSQNRTKQIKEGSIVKPIPPSLKDKIFANDGSTQIRVLEKDIPIGFVKGRLYVTCPICGYTADTSNYGRYHKNAHSQQN